MRASRLLNTLLVLSLALSLGSCGCADEFFGSSVLGTNEITVGALQGGPFPVDASMPFTLDVQGLELAPGSVIDVIFCATAGTPFLGGTSSEATVPATVISPGVVQGSTPPAVSSIAFDVVIKVVVPPAMGGTGEPVSSGGPASMFEPATATGCGPALIQANQATAFTVTGTNFAPIGGTVMIDFCAPTGTPFAGGTSDTHSALGTIVNATTIQANVAPTVVSGGRVTATVKVTMTSGVMLTCPDQPVFNMPPACSSDTFANLLGNVVTAADGSRNVLTNDSDPDGDPITIVASDTTTLQGGSVVVDAGGTFTYTPPAGFRGTDSFTYTISDGDASCLATVTLGVSCVVWFIDDSAATGGNGTQATPFDSLADMAAIQGGPMGGASGDIIYLYEGSYTGGITLLADQCLLGAGVDLVAKSQTLETAGMAPTLTQPSGHAVTLATGNCVRGLDIVSTGGSAIFGTSVGTLTVESNALSSTNAAVLDLSGGTVDLDIGTLTSTGSAGAGLRLVGLAGDIDVTGLTTVNASASHGVEFTNGSATLDLNGVTATNSGGSSVYICMATGAVNIAGTVNSTGATVDAVTVCNSASAVSLSRIEIINAGQSGICLTNNTGTFSANGGGFIDWTGVTNATGIKASNIDCLTLEGTTDANRIAIYDAASDVGAAGHAIDVDGARCVTLRLFDIARVGDVAGTDEHGICLTGVVENITMYRVMVAEVHAGDGICIENGALAAPFVLSYMMCEVSDASGHGFRAPLGVVAGGSLDATVQTIAMNNIGGHCFWFDLEGNASEVAPSRVRILSTVLTNMGGDALVLDTGTAGTFEMRANDNTWRGNPGGMSTPGCGMKMHVGPGTTNHLTLKDNWVDQFGMQGIMLGFSASPTDAVLTADIDTNLITNNLGAGFEARVLDGATLNLTYRGNSAVSNVSPTLVGFTSDTTGVLRAWLSMNEDSLGYILERPNTGTFELGGALGQGMSFATDNGNIAGQGNLTGGAAPVVTMGGTGLGNLLIIDPTTVPTPTVP